MKDQKVLTPENSGNPPPEPEPKPEPAAVPEKYEFKAPEGRELDSTVIEAATPVFKELGINQDQAQKLMDLYDKVHGDTEKTTQTAIEEMRATWKKELSADKDIGSKLPEVQANIGKALQQLPQDQVASFKSLMDTTGLGDNPIMIKVLNSFASAFNEGKHVSGSGPAKTGQDKPGAPPPTLAGAMYPHLK